MVNVAHSLLHHELLSISDWLGLCLLHMTTCESARYAISLLRHKLRCILDSK